MRWHELFADLEGQADSFERSERDLEIAERTRAELGQISLVNRLRAQVGEQVTLTLTGGEHVSGELDQVGADWLLFGDPEETLVPLAAIATVRDLSPAAVSPDSVSAVSSRISMSSAMRALAVDRALVSVVLRDGASMVGTPDRVGADFFDLALHDRGVAPRRSAVKARVTVPHAVVALVRRSGQRWT